MEQQNNNSQKQKEESQEGIDLQGKLEECQRQKEEYLAGWQRARADFLNYKKEEMERIQALVGYAKEEFLLNILPIIDNICRAEKIIPEQKKEDEHIKGLLQMKSQLMNFFSRQGVEEIKTEGEKFDPTLHEVIEEKECEGTEPGIILEELQKGYTMDGRVLRPAKVKVTKL